MRPVRVVTEQRRVGTELENILQMYETIHCIDKYAHLCCICWFESGLERMPYIMERPVQTNRSIRNSGRIFKVSILITRSDATVTSMELRALNKYTVTDFDASESYVLVYNASSM
jgi:hypothetical protein